MKTYCGIGSRETVPEQLAQMTRLGKYLAQNNWLLRSGGAKGADSAFEEGCKLSMLADQRQIFYADRWFDQGKYKNYDPELLEDAMALAERFHPAWERCGIYTRKLMARNGFQVLGSDLESPADMIMCWTKDGKASGGTGQAIRIAHAYEIPVFNLYNSADVEKAKTLLGINS